MRYNLYTKKKKRVYCVSNKQEPFPAVPSKHYQRNKGRRFAPARGERLRVRRSVTQPWKTSALASQKVVRRPHLISRSALKRLFGICVLACLNQPWRELKKHRCCQGHRPAKVTGVLLRQPRAQGPRHALPLRSAQSLLMGSLPADILRTETWVAVP